MLMSSEAMRAAVGSKGRAVEVLHHAQDLLCGLAPPPDSAASFSEGVHKAPGRCHPLTAAQIDIIAGQISMKHIGLLFQVGRLPVVRAGCRCSDVRLWWQCACVRLSLHFLFV